MEENHHHEEHNAAHAEGHETDAQGPQVDPLKLQQYMEKLRMEQNLPMGILGGFIGCLVGAILWALIAVATGYMIGYIAVAVGFLAGYGTRILGKGIDTVFGIVGAILALFGCILGNVFTYASILGLGVGDVLGNFGDMIGLVLENFGFMDILFYGLALYMGYQFAFRKVKEEEIIENVT